MQSPYLKLFGKPPNYNKLRIFGCACYPWLKPYNRHKLQDRSTRCVFFGYSATQSAFLCYDEINDRLYTSRHVQFDEDVFPFSESRNTNPRADDDTTTSPSCPVSSIPVFSPQQPLVSDPHPTSPTISSRHHHLRQHRYRL